ncbi:MAG TPA: FGLLP motif-containing membrane protein [Acidimicrobiales bacterium]|nr:FGLLP motif-containing membrane protein [Acidimicrobiales bacterium]
MSRTYPLLLVAVVTMFVGYADPASASNNEIVNGTFGAPVVGTGSDEFISTGSSFSGWRVVGAPGNVGVTSGTFAQNGFTFDSDHSPQFLDLTGTSNSRTGVAQSVPSVRGTRYTLSFAVGNVYDPTGIFGTTSSIEVLINGAREYTATNSKGRGSSRQQWQTFSLSIVATTAVTDIEFLNLDPPSDTSNCLDDVTFSTPSSSIAPSSIATSIPTPREAFLPVKSLAVNGGIAAAVVMLLTFPSQLFNSTLQQNYAVIESWWRKKLGRLARRQRRMSAADESNSDQSRSGATMLLERRSIFSLVFVCGALAEAFNDGHFGVSVSSLVTLVAVAISMAIGIALPTVVGVIYHSNRHGSAPRKLIAIPAGLALAVAMVVFSRLIHFEPGYLYGLVCGVVFVRELPSNEKGHIAALGILTALVLSVISWMIWIPVNAAAVRANPFVGVVLADDILGALFVGGLVGSFFGMIPIRGLPGWTIKQWNVGAWLAGFAISAFGLFQILLRPGIVGHGHRPLVASIVLFVVFGAGSIAFREYFERRPRQVQGPAEGQPAT